MKQQEVIHYQLRHHQEIGEREKDSFDDLITILIFEKFFCGLKKADMLFQWTYKKIFLQVQVKDKDQR